MEKLLDKTERRKRLIEDFRKIAIATGRDELEVMTFAAAIPDEQLDKLEEEGWSSDRKVTIDQNEINHNLTIVPPEIDKENQNNIIKLDDLIGTEKVKSLNEKLKNIKEEREEKINHFYGNVT